MSASKSLTDWKTILACVLGVASILFVGGKQYGDNEANTKAVAEQRSQIADLKTQAQVEASDTKDLRTDAAETRADVKQLIESVERIDRHVVAECAARTHNPELCSK